MKRAFFAVLGLALIVFQNAWAQELNVENSFDRDVARPVLDFSGVQSNLAEGPTQVLVLGTPHLNGLAEKLPLSDLSLLLERLENWAPDLIATEDTVARHCDVLDAYAPLYIGVAERYCVDPSPAAEDLGLSRAEATAEIVNTFRSWPDAPDPEDRRRLVGLLWAAGEANSAALQWLRLEESERRSDENVSDQLVSKLNERLTLRNESVSIGAVLGARLGHERLHPMDDRSADVVLGQARPTAGPAIQRVWDADYNGAKEMRATNEAMLGSPEGVLRYYRAINSAEYQQNVLDNDFATVATQPDDAGAARAYLAWWQARGLRMAANVIEATANAPGERVLIIVGSSHKSYFEAYLDAMHDVTLVPIESVLTQ